MSDLGWQDTVLIWPGESVHIVIDFSHNLQRADAGMMANYRVIG